MARLGELTTVEPGVTRCDFVLGYHHWGTKEALIRAGVAQPEWFLDGRRDQRGRKVRTVKAVHNDQAVRCVAQRNGRYQVTNYYAGADRKRTWPGTPDTLFTEADGRQLAVDMLRDIAALGLDEQCIDHDECRDGRPQRIDIIPRYLETLRARQSSAGNQPVSSTRDSVHARK